jgi:low temperature requirement protein LtrA
MPLINLIVVLIVVGLLLWAVQYAIPMDATIKRIITVVVIVAVCLWLLGLFFPGLGTFRVGH